MLTKTTVRQAPARPDKTYRTLKNAGKIVIRVGIMYSAVRSAITPADI